MLPPSADAHPETYDAQDARIILSFFMREVPASMELFSVEKSSSSKSVDSK